jgi:RNA polymerase-binding transcription factor DksA
MTRIQKEIRTKLQLERQVLSVQLQRVTGRTANEPVSTIDLQMHRKLQVRLASIERAIARLEKGTFGVCQSCGKEIENARLEALPYAEQCIDCQRKLERRTIRPYVYASPIHQVKRSQI